MLSIRFAPRVVKMMLAGEIVLLAGLIILARIGLISRHEQLEGMVGLIFALVAHVIAIMLYLGVANEYRNVRLSRLVWLAFAINSALLLLRGVVSTVIVAALSTTFLTHHCAGFLITCSVSQRVCLAARAARDGAIIPPLRIGDEAQDP